MRTQRNQYTNYYIPLSPQGGVDPGLEALIGWDQRTRCARHSCITIGWDPQVSGSRGSAPFVVRFSSLVRPRRVSAFPAMPSTLPVFLSRFRPHMANSNAPYSMWIILGTTWLCARMSASLESHMTDLAEARTLQCFFSCPVRAPMSYCTVE